MSKYHGIGYWLTRKYRRQRRERGVRAAAANLRRQGVPVDLALRILGVAPSGARPVSRSAAEDAGG